jgi:hypothetical protein
MAADYCCASAGGTLRLTIDGVVYPVRGSVTIQPSKYDAEAGSNLDGSLWVTYKPVPVMVEMALSDFCGLSIIDLQKKVCTQATIELDHVNRTYILVNASVIGRPSLNPETGEISSVKMVAADIREIQDS